MRERVKQLGGRLEIATGRGGTTVKATIPSRHFRILAPADEPQSGMLRVLTPETAIKVFPTTKHSPFRSSPLEAGVARHSRDRSAW
jgi:hypothetical protein